jgi:hypothetical protein
VELSLVHFSEAVATRALRALMVLALGVTLFLGPATLAAQERTPADDLTELRTTVTMALEALGAGDMAGARAAYTAFDDGWEDIEDGIRAKDRDMYRAIEGVMDEVKSALLRPDSPNADEAVAELMRLDAQIDVALPALR